MEKVLVLKGRQLGLKTIAKRFKMFLDIRKPYWKGTDEDLVKNIFDDPDFLEPFIRKERSPMTLPEAQNIAFRLVNLKSDKVTIEEIKHALIILANFYEDYKSEYEYDIENSRKSEKCL